MATRSRVKTSHPPRRSPPRRQRGRRSARRGWPHVNFSLNLDQPLQQEIWGILYAAVGILSLLGLVVPGAGGPWGRLLATTFGWGAALPALAFVYFGYLFVRQGVTHLPQLTVGRVMGALALVLASLGLLHSLAPDGAQWADTGRGGGQVGLAMASLARGSLGSLGGPFGLLVVLLLSLVIGFQLSLARLYGWLSTTARVLALAFAKPLREPAVSIAAPARVVPEPEIIPGPAIAPAAPAATAPVVEPPHAEPYQVRRAVTTTTAYRQHGAKLDAVEQFSRTWKLPPTDILQVFTAAEVRETEIKKKARTIEETLASFHVEARVREVNVGPTVTQFALEPGPGVKVRRITSLSNDLALALAASSIRIEAPVPGHPRVGIEIPNQAVSLVGLRSVLETPEYEAVPSKLKIGLGRDVSGVPVVADLARMPHLLIAGATGSGKSVCINAIIACYLLQATPDDLRFLMIDPKMVELTTYNGIPHLIAPVVTETDKVVNVLKWALGEMERRYRLFAEHTCRNLVSYNKKAAAPGSHLPRLPYLVIIIDELADLMMTAPDEVESCVCRLAQMARATGMHLILATQRPSVDVVTGLIKANFPSRIAFAVSSQIDSRVILDSPGAEKLLGKGDMLYVASDAGKAQRVQGTFLSDDEIEALVQFWKRSVDEPAYDPEALRAQSEAAPPAESADDELLDEAIALVKKHQAASASMLQRRLRIGYSRAARLVDQLEERGIIGPPGRNGAREILAGPDEDVEEEAEPAPR